MSQLSIFLTLCCMAQGLRSVNHLVTTARLSHRALEPAYVTAEYTQSTGGRQVWSVSTHEGCS
jgi:hypothetical protein